MDNEERLQFTIDTAIDELKEGKCILFLGPELLINEPEEKYYKVYFKELAKNNPEFIFKYFSRDNVFSFTKTGDVNYDIFRETRIRNEIKKFYDTNGDEILLNLIAQLPFPLIVNVAPDNAINKIFTRNGLPYRAAYFPDPNEYNIKKPVINDPVIYNIFGSIQEKQSLVLTHEELFKKIKDLMQKDAIPPEIEKIIRGATSFIFLGMRFETWYYQLLLSIFNIEISTSTKLGAPKDNDEETVSIMDKYFHIAFTKSNSLEFIGKIYDEIKKNSPKFLRTATVQTTTSVYISYAWKDDNDLNREKWVLNSEDKLKENKINVLKDRNELTIQDSIEAFMNRIGRGRIVLMVVSEKYLLSPYCMYEAWSVFKNDNFVDRAFIIILPDVDFKNKEKYIEYWQNKTNEMRNKIETTFNNDYLAFDEFMTNYKSDFYILLFINQFLKILTNQIWFRVIEEKDDEAKKTNEQNFKVFMKEMLQKLEEA